MAGEITRTVLAEVSKYLQLGPLISAYNEESVLFDLVKAQTKVLDIGGRTSGWLAPIRSTRAAGFYSRAEAATIGTPVPADYAEQIVPARYVYVPVTLTGPAEEFGAGSANAMVDAVVETVENANRAMARNMARVLWGNGSGALCLINGTQSATTTIECDSPGTQWLSPGMILDVGAALDAATISSVDSGVQFTTADSEDFADNDIVYIDGNKDIEPMGLGGILYDGTTVLWTDLAATTSINGLTRSAATWTYANGCTAAGSTITQNMLTVMQNRRTNGGATNKNSLVILCPPGVRNSLYWLAASKINYITPTSSVGGAPNFNLGVSDFSFNGVRVMEDPQAPQTATTGPAVILDTDFLEMYWTGAPHLDEWLPGGATSDVKGTKLICYTSGLVCRNYKAQGYVPSITINNSSAA